MCAYFRVRVCVCVCTCLYVCACVCVVRLCYCVFVTSTDAVGELLRGEKPPDVCSKELKLKKRFRGFAMKTPIPRTRHMALVLCCFHVATLDFEIICIHACICTFMCVRVCTCLCVCVGV
jgi:hypothetical protein